MAKKFKEAREKKKDNKKVWLVGIFMAVIMVTSIIGFMVGENPDQTKKYNGIKFYRTNTGWEAKINGKMIQFMLLPEEVENVSISADILYGLKAGKMAQITFDSNAAYPQETALVQYQLQQTMNNALNIYAITGLTDVPKNVTYTGILVGCQNATQYVPVILLAYGEETKITENNSCIILEAQSTYDMYALKDRLVYGLLDIIK